MIKHSAKLFAPSDYPEGEYLRKVIPQEAHRSIKEGDKKGSKVTVETVNRLYDAVVWAARIATGRIDAFGNSEEKAAMADSIVSVRKLGKVVDAATGEGDSKMLRSEFDALKVTWAGIDSAYKGKYSAAGDLAKIPRAVDAAYEKIVPQAAPDRLMS